MSRGSEVSHRSKKKDFNLSLLENALEDPASKNLILQLLSANKKQHLFDFFNPGSLKLVSPLRRVKKNEHCESPTALLRRRELEKQSRPESSLSHTSEQSTQSTTNNCSSIPFDIILKDVVAYVEINSNGTDRSGGAKVLLRSMGALVSEKFTRDVTHVIFKDGLYTTYQRAKLLKVHLVSVLWLEASRRNGVKADEKSYPALGTKNYDLNASMICSQMQKDYEDVIREEIKKTFESGSSLPSTETFSDRRKTLGSTSKSYDMSSQFGSGFNGTNLGTIVSKIHEESSSQKLQPSSIILDNCSPSVSTDSDLSGNLTKVQNNFNWMSDSSTPPSIILEENEESDTASECGIIDGNFNKKNASLDYIMEKIASFKSDNTNIMELTCTEQSNSELFLGKKNETSNSISNMDMTTSKGAGILETIKGSLLNSLSYPTSRQKSTANLVKANEMNKKANYSITSPRNTLRKTRQFSQKSTCGNTKNVSCELVSTPTIEDDNAITKEVFDSLKTPKASVSNRKLPKPLNSLSDDYSALDVLNPNTVTSQLRISKLKGKTSSSSNCSKSFQRYSLETSKNSTESLMPSLRLSKSSLENSGILNVTNNVDEESIRKSSLNTPYVTERKKRNRTSLRTNLLTSWDDSSSSQTDSRITRRSIRESAKFKRNKGEFCEKSKENKYPHNKGVEIEIVVKRDSEVSTPRPARKFPSRTPTKSDVFISPFVNTRSRTKSTAGILENEAVDVNMQNQTFTARNSLKISTGQDDATPAKFADDLEKSRVEDQQSSKADSEGEGLSNIMKENENYDQDNFSKSKNPIVLLQDVSVSLPVKGKYARKSSGHQDKCVVSLVSISKEDFDISPPKKKRSDKKSVSRKHLITNENEEDDINNLRNMRKSGRKTTRLVSELATRKGETSRTDIEIEKENSETGTEQKISSRKSESDARKTTNNRKSRRVRKLYDPNLDTEHQIHEILGVNDHEERETRQRKVLKVNIRSQDHWLGGNVLMTQKAVEFLENTQDNIVRLFKEPESVLDHPVVDRIQKERTEDTVVNISGDEQVNLAKEFVNKRFKNSCKENKASQQALITRKSSRQLTQRAIATSNDKRRSTMDFVPKSLTMPKVKTNLNLDQKPTIVCTKLHKAEVQVFNSIVKKLGGFEVEDEVSTKTTHLVVGEIKRTVNMLRAICRGCWIVRHEWLLSSLENGRWLPEEKYEVSEFSPAVQQCRLRRQAFGPSYHMNIFLDCGNIYVAKFTVPRCSDIRELITLCEGKVTKIPDNAKISVGIYLDGCDSVNEFWVLDSIKSGKLEPIENYVILVSDVKAKSPYV